MGSATRSPTSFSTTHRRKNWWSGSTSCFLLDHIPKQKPGLQVVHVNLFDFVIQHLKSRGLLDKSFEMEKTKGKDHLRKHLEKVLHPEKLAPLLGGTDSERPDRSGPDLRRRQCVAVSAVKQRAEQPAQVHGQDPRGHVLPGHLRQVSFRLFGKIRDKEKQDNYYRAFRLIP